MFGIGFEEFFIIAIVLLLAVGPDKMPTLLKAVGKGVREFRRATRELKSSVGLDELMKDEDLRELRNLSRGGLTAPDRKYTPPVPARYELTDADYKKEQPPEGVDLRFLAEHSSKEDDEEPAPGPTVEPEESA